MEHFEDEISSIDEESNSLLNYESSSDKKSEDIKFLDINNDFEDDVEDTRSELKFDKGRYIWFLRVFLQC